MTTPSKLLAACITGAGLWMVLLGNLPTGAVCAIIGAAWLCAEPPEPEP